MRDASKNLHKHIETTEKEDIPMCKMKIEKSFGFEEIHKNTEKDLKKSVEEYDTNIDEDTNALKELQKQLKSKSAKTNPELRKLIESAISVLKKKIMDDSESRDLQMLYHDEQKTYIKQDRNNRKALYEQYEDEQRYLEKLIKTSKNIDRILNIADGILNSKKSAIIQERDEVLAEIAALNDAIEKVKKQIETYKSKRDSLEKSSQGGRKDYAQNIEKQIDLKEASLVKKQNQLKELEEKLKSINELL